MVARGLGVYSLVLWGWFGDECRERGISVWYMAKREICGLRRREERKGERCGA